MQWNEKNQIVNKCNLSLEESCQRSGRILTQAKEASQKKYIQSESIYVKFKN